MPIAQATTPVVEVKATVQQSCDLATALDQGGFRYDDDFEMLYGAGWAISGVRITNMAALPVVHAAIAGMQA